MEDDEDICIEEEEEEENEVMVDEVFLTNVLFELDEKDEANPAEGDITARNSSISISPSPLASPRAKMESISIGVIFEPLGSTAAFSSFLLKTPSPSASIFLKAAAAPSLPLNS